MREYFQSYSDEALARSTQEGSLEAFEELVRRYEDRICGFVRHHCGSETAMRSIAQDTFVAGFQRMHQFDTQRAFAPWLFAIARRKAIDHRRSERPAAGLEAAEEPRDEVDPSELLALREERESIWRLARKVLTATQADALWLKYAAEMEVAGIAKVLGLTQTHVKVLLFRARRKLASELKKPQDADGRFGVTSQKPDRPAAGLPTIASSPFSRKSLV